MGKSRDLAPAGTQLALSATNSSAIWTGQTRKLRCPFRPQAYRWGLLDVNDLEHLPRLGSRAVLALTAIETANGRRRLALREPCLSSALFGVSACTI